MAKYSEEVIKQAEELIEKHSKFSSKLPDTWGGSQIEYNRKKAVEAAIVSCEFAGVDNFLKVLTSTEVGFTYIKYGRIKSYLEELL